MTDQAGDEAEGRAAWGDILRRFERWTELTSARVVRRRELASLDGEAGYRAALGEYLADWLRVEGTIDTLLAIYFGETDTWIELRDLVIAEMGFAAKVKVIAKVSAVGDADDLADARRICRALDTANERRNQLAHHRPDFADTSRTEFTIGRKAIPLALTDLHRELEVLDDLQLEVIALLVYVGLAKERSRVSAD